MPVARPAALVLAALVVIGCSGSPSSEADTTAASPGAQPAQGASTGGSNLQADLDEVNDYELTMEDLEKYVTATTAMVRAAQANPGADEGGADDAAGSGGDPNSLEAMESQIEASPVMRKAVEDAGLDAREYATISYAYMGASMAAGMMKAANLTADSVGKAMKVNPANVTFVAQNEAAIARLMARMAEDARRGQ